MSQVNGREGNGVRRLTPEQRRRIIELRKRKQRKKRLMVIVSAAAVLTLAVVLALVLPIGRRSDRHEELTLNAATSAPEIVAETVTETEPPIVPVTSEDASAVAAFKDPDVPVGEDVSTDIDLAAATESTPTQENESYTSPTGNFVYDDAYVAAALGSDTGPLITPDFSNVDSSKLARWPEVTEGYMPILYHAENTTENIIAVTVDDCFQAQNLQQIVQCALNNNSQLTIFPIGDNLAKEKVGTVVKWAWENGMEIENHTYNHVGLFHYDDERMMQEIWMQSMRLNQVLGVNYKEHFFRPRGGDERSDQRVHACVNQLGMSAIAIWTQSGSTDSMESLINNLAPGRIYLFHTTDNDLSKLLQFIPAAVQRGYRLVTLNEMFGLPDNETSDLSAVGEAPTLQPFHIIPATLRKTSYMRAASVVQKRLIELGWLEGEADGIYGQSSFVATGYFQLAADMTPDGKAGPATQAALFASDAPANTSENQAKIKAKMSK